MGNFEFKSQICTTRVQSGRLLALGLKRETADMHWCYHSVTATWYVVTHPYDGIGDWLPAWSLHRLIEMSLHLSYGVAYCYTAGSNMNETYDEVVDMIEWAISKECFNKDYLEEKI